MARIPKRPENISPDAELRTAVEISMCGTPGCIPCLSRALTVLTTGMIEGEDFDERPEQVAFYLLILAAARQAQEPGMDDTVPALLDFLKASKGAWEFAEELRGLDAQREAVGQPKH